MRRFALVLSACAILGASESWALGLGDIRVRSSFNTNFMAVIPVFLEAGDADLKVETGKMEDYALLQVGRPPFIDQLRIAVGDDPDKPGVKAILVTSKDPIAQPSFNLVIRASAGGGSILENYFLAVDFRKSLSLDLPEPDEKKASAPTPVEERPMEIAAVMAVPPAPPLASPAPTSVPVPVAEPPVVQPLAETSSTPPPSPEPQMAPVEPLPAASVIVQGPPPVEQKVQQTAVEEFQPEPAEPAPPPAVEREPEPEKPVAEPLAPVPVLLPTMDNGAGNVVQVRKGDTLFSIARQLNAQRTELARVVVAIYLANKESFIGPNIHGLKQGATLSYAKVNEIASTVTAEEARAILDNDWKSWQNPERPSAVEMPLERAVPAEEIAAFIDNWKKHWMTKSPALADDYADDFRGQDNVRKKEWMEAKREIAESNTNINLEVGELKMGRSGGGVAVTFRQTFRSDQYFSTGEKTLVLRPVPGGLHITEERFRASRSEDRRKMWSVQVAAYASGAMAAAHIRNLSLRRVVAFSAGVSPDSLAHVVMAGRFASREAARDLATRLLGMGERNLKVVRFPFSLRVGTFATREEADAVAVKLARDGHTPFVAECVVDGKTETAAYLGAFATKEEAERALKGLTIGGYAAEAAIP